MIFPQLNYNSNLDYSHFEELGNYEKLLYLSLASYLIEKRPEKDRNFYNIIKLIKMTEDYLGAKSPVDLLMEDLKKENCYSKAYSHWQIFKILPKKERRLTCVNLYVFLLNNLDENELFCKNLEQCIFEEKTSLDIDF